MQGRFEILSLSGSFTVSDTGGVRSRTGGLSVSLAGPDGRVIGGGLAGILTAAGPIQVRPYSLTRMELCIHAYSYYLQVIYNRIHFGALLF